MKRNYDSTIARIAGNVAPAMMNRYPPAYPASGIATAAVELARLIVAEVERTSPPLPADQETPQQ